MRLFPVLLCWCVCVCATCDVWDDDPAQCWLNPDLDCVHDGLSRCLPYSSDCSVADGDVLYCESILPCNYNVTSATCVSQNVSSTLWSECHSNFTVSGAWTCITESAGVCQWWPQYARCVPRLTSWCPSAHIDCQSFAGCDWLVDAEDGRCEPLSETGYYCPGETTHEACNLVVGCSWSVSDAMCRARQLTSDQLQYDRGVQAYCNRDYDIGSLTTACVRNIQPCARLCDSRLGPVCSNHTSLTNTPVYDAAFGCDQDEAYGLCSRYDSVDHVCVQLEAAGLQCYWNSSASACLQLTDEEGVLGVVDLQSLVDGDNIAGTWLAVTTGIVVFGVVAAGFVFLNARSALEQSIQTKRGVKGRVQVLESTASSVKTRTKKPL